MDLPQLSPVILSLDTARTATAAAIVAVEEVGIPYTLSVVDGAGQLVHVTRLDGAVIGSIDTSLAKARTAVFFGAATADLAGAVADGSPLATIQTATSVPLAFVAGGVPITDADGVVIGGFGAAGGSPEQDHRVAHAAVEAIRA
ncbi:heme-binding protein [Microbacterium awajiense]|uniref:Heme-binding protein n=1 Tax=Microbacterium awajiense TaxID=415214 RepID=A0ABP7AHC9_9MICO